MNITPLSQRDPRWKNKKLGTSNVTIGNYGCFITSIAMVLGTTPDIVNNTLKDNGGYYKGNLVIWQKVVELFGGDMPVVLAPYDNTVAKSYVDRGVPVMVIVDGAPIGASMHMVVYIGNGKMIDPWTGTIEPTGKYKALKMIVYVVGKKEEPKEEKVVYKECIEWQQIKTTMNEKFSDKSRIEYFSDEPSRIINEIVVLEEKVARLEKIVDDQTKLIAEFETMSKKKNEELTSVKNKLKAEKQHHNEFVVSTRTEIEELKEEIGRKDDELLNTNIDLEACQKSLNGLEPKPITKPEQTVWVSDRQIKNNLVASIAIKLDELLSIVSKP